MSPICIVISWPILTPNIWHKIEVLKVILYFAILFLTPLLNYLIYTKHSSFHNNNFTMKPMHDTENTNIRMKYNYNFECNVRKLTPYIMHLVLF